MKKILIVEDELIVRSIYRRKFEMSGYQVETAEEGAAALKIMPDFKPDLIQLDIAMPGMDGVEVIRQIRAWPEFSSVPILVVSSFYRPDLAKQAWKAGASKCVSKMDCTPNLALELVEQLLSGQDTGFMRKFGTIALARDALDLPPGKSAASPQASSTATDLPSTQKTSPSLPTFSQSNAGSPPANNDQAEKSAFFGITAPPPFKSLTLPTFTSARPTSTQLERMSEDERLEAKAHPPGGAAPHKPEEPGPAVATDFRFEIRQDFLKRVPLIQAELRERVGGLIKSKSTSEQLVLLKELESSISSLASLAGISGFSRVSHLAGAIDALIKDLNKKPSQMTASVLRTIAHAMDCMNVLFRDLAQLPKDIPQSMLILAVDDEPISRRTISMALGKANLRCIAMEDSKMALTVLKENQFDLIFLDAEMPGMTGFELCTELRKLPTNKNTPVIFVTSLTKFETRAQSSLSGGSDLIAKPFLMMELAVKALTYLLKPPLSVEAKIHTAQAAK